VPSWACLCWSGRHELAAELTEERDAALVATVERLDARPALTAGQVARFRG
jgi:hypothetical protein